jgi:sphingomyelin phosphodiesterase acid-like 3
MFKKFSIFLCLSAATFIVNAASLSQERFIVISDIHLKTAQTNAMDIDPKGTSRQNDLDLNTSKALFSLIAPAIQKLHPDFILITGDIAGHRIITQSKATAQDEKTVFQSLSTYFPAIPVFYVFGNNDSLQNDYGAFTEAGNSPFKIAVASGWKDGFLSTGAFCKNHSAPCLIEENKQEGYYSAQLTQQLRLIGLNSVAFAVQGPDKNTAVRELAWLQQSLAAAQKAHQSVLIAMHIPFGKNLYDGTPFWDPSIEQSFLALYKQYQATITGVLVGHTHMEELKLIQDNHQTIGAEYYTAGLSTSHGNSPSFKLFSFSKEASTPWQFNNYTTYEIHETSNHSLTLGVAYDFKYYYGALSKVTLKALEKRYTVDNPHFNVMLTHPEGLVVNLP